MSTPDPRSPGTPGSDPTLGSAEGERPSPPPVRSTGPDGQSSAGKTGASTGRNVGRSIALALLVFVVVVLVLFVVFNTQTVQISLVFTDVRAPLVVALLVGAVLGGLIVGLLDAVLVVRNRRKKR